MSGNNMYRLGDYVYFENAPASSYVIRKIEELNRTANGNVEAKVLCFYRRSEVPKTLLVRTSLRMMDLKLHYEKFYFTVKIKGLLLSKLLPFTHH
jgi:hypothetical protein